jgi:hypothetical protein
MSSLRDFFPGLKSVFRESLRAVGTLCVWGNIRLQTFCTYGAITRFYFCVSIGLPAQTLDQHGIFLREIADEEDLLRRKINRVS